MVARVELASSSPLQEAATHIITTRHKEVTAVYGTALQAGTDLARWKPYHATELVRSPKIFDSIFTSALDEPNTNLSPADLPVLQITASLFYPTFDDFYAVDSSLIIEKMRAVKVFAGRDFHMVPDLVTAATLKSSPDASLGRPQINGEAAFVSQQKVFADGMGCFKTVPDAMLLVGLLAVERLVEHDAIRTGAGHLPRSLREALAEGTTYESTVLHAHREKQKEIFQQPYVPLLLATQQVLPHFEANQNAFFRRIDPLLAEENVDLRSLFNEAIAISQQQVTANNAPQNFPLTEAVSTHLGQIR